jgi:RNA polymerase sigma-70 factor (ECF subfamily)
MAEWETLAVGHDRPADRARVDIAQVFEASYRRLVVQLYGVVGNAGEAEDLVQEAFVRAYAAGPRFTRVENPEAWLRTTAVNLYRSRWRKMRNFARIRDRIAGPPDLPGLEEHLVVVEALRRLPENMRVVLTLHYLADRDVQQIAAELDIPEGTVKSRLSRARDALAAVLSEEQDHE